MLSDYQPKIMIPDDWNAEQAYQVWEWLNELADAVWRAYEIPIVELIRPDPDPPEPEHEETDSPEFGPSDSEIPF